MLVPFGFTYTLHVYVSGAFIETCVIYSFPVVKSYLSKFVKIYFPVILFIVVLIFIMKTNIIVDHNKKKDKKGKNK